MTCLEIYNKGLALIYKISISLQLLLSGVIGTTVPSFLELWTGWSADWRGWRPPLVNVLQNYLVCVLTRMSKLILGSKHDLNRVSPHLLLVSPFLFCFFRNIGSVTLCFSRKS